MRRMTIGAVLFLLVGCIQSGPSAQTPASLLSGVNIADGISRSEAGHIAEAYFARHVGCGTYSGITETDSAWVVEGKHGFAGDPIEGFLINKKSGAITSPVGPSYAQPEDMLRRVQQGAASNRAAPRHIS